MTAQQLPFADERLARHSDPQTSHIAAQRRAPQAMLIADVVEAAGSHGATCDEIGRQMATVWRDTLRGAVSRCAERGLIVDSKRTRPSDRGGPMTVYVNPRWAP